MTQGCANCKICNKLYKYITYHYKISRFQITITTFLKISHSDISNAFYSPEMN